jgi:hypothetical protein
MQCHEVWRRNERSRKGGLGGDVKSEQKRKEGENSKEKGSRGRGVVPGVEGLEVLGDLLLYGTVLGLEVSMLSLSIISFFSLVEAVRGLKTACLTGA